MCQIFGLENRMASTTTSSHRCVKKAFNLPAAYARSTQIIRQHTMWMVFHLFTSYSSSFFFNFFLSFFLFCLFRFNFFLSTENCFVCTENIRKWCETEKLLIGFYVRKSKWVLVSLRNSQNVRHPHPVKIVCLLNSAPSSSKPPFETRPSGTAFDRIPSTAISHSHIFTSFRIVLITKSLSFFRFRRWRHCEMQWTTNECHPNNTKMGNHSRIGVLHRCNIEINR